MSGPLIRFGLGLPTLEDPGEREPLRRTFEIASLAERCGFDAGLVGHHHFTHGYLEPMVTLGALAARTGRMLVGTGVYLLPLHHPVVVAEQIATLDRISGGRAVLGIGVGYRPYEFEGLGIDFHRRGDRATEALEVIRAAWSGGPVEHAGRHFTIPGLEIPPAPLQEPHPPIWVGAVARRAQARAALLGDAWLSDFMQTLPVEARLADRYRAMCADAGRPSQVCLMRTAYVARTRDEVAADWLPDAAQMQLSYWRAGARGRDDEGIFERLDRGEAVDVAEFAHDRAIAGTPSDCVDQIRRWHQATGCEWLILSIGGRQDPDALARTIELFGNEVIPAFS